MAIDYCCKAVKIIFILINGVLIVSISFISCCYLHIEIKRAINQNKRLTWRELGKTSSDIQDNRINIKLDDLMIHVQF